MEEGPSRLVAAHRIDVHRRLGISAAFVAVLFAVQVVSMAIGKAAAGHAPPGRNPRRFLSTPLGAATMFALFVGGALVLRREREWRERLLLLATMAWLTPAIARLDAQVMQPLGLPRLVLAPIVTFGFIAWACPHDWRRLGPMTDAWLPIARWLTQAAS
jgi:hypothetical protein